MDIRAIFLDIDGTLVSFNTHRIPESAVSALAEARKKGIKVFIATGRPTIIIDNIGQLQSAGLIDGYITMNGAYCYRGDRTVSSTAIPPHCVSSVWKWCVDHGRTCIAIREHDLCISRDSDQLQEIFYKQLKCTTLMPELKPGQDINSRPIFQLTAFFTPDEEQSSELASALNGCSTGRWHNSFTDITAAGCTKSTGIDAFATAFGFSLGQTMAFGDGGNDIPMLKHAGTGIAMGGASDIVKAASDYITDDVDNDGIRNALVHFGII